MVGSSSMAGALLVAVFFSKVEFWEVVGGSGLCRVLRNMKRFSTIFSYWYILVVKHGKMEIFYMCKYFNSKQRA